MVCAQPMAQSPGLLRYLAHIASADCWIRTWDQALESIHNSPRQLMRTPLKPLPSLAMLTAALVITGCCATTTARSPGRAATRVSPRPATTQRDAQPATTQRDAQPAATDRAPA